MTLGCKNAFFLVFDIYYFALKIVTYVMPCTRYASKKKKKKEKTCITGKIFIKIWAHLGSFQLIYTLSHLSSYRPILSSNRVILNIFRVFWARLGLFRYILFFGSFRLQQTVLSSCRLIRAHLSLLGSFRLLWLD